MKLNCQIRFLGVLIAASAAGVTGFGQTVAYTNATIESMGEAGQIQNGILVVRGDKIVDIGSDVKIPDDARIVSMTGKTIMPGLIDPYFVYRQNSGSSGASRTVTFGGRTITIPGRTTFSAGTFGRIGEYFYPYKFDFMPSVRSGITTANLVSNGQGLSALANISDERSPDMLFDQDGFIFAQVTNRTSGLDIVRRPLSPAPAKSTGKSASNSTGRPSSTRTSTTATRSSGSTEKSSADEIKNFWDAVREGKSPLFVNVNNQASVAHLLQIVKELEKVRLILVATGPNLFESLEELKNNKNVTVVLQPGIDRVPFTTDLMNVPQMLADKQIPFSISMSLSVSQLRASQDDPMFPLAMLARTGLDRETTLQSVTIKPAKLLGIEKTHGSLEKDKQASFLVFDGDPLETGSRLEQVILNGDKTYEN